MIQWQCHCAGRASSSRNGKLEIVYGRVKSKALTPGAIFEAPRKVFGFEIPQNHDVVFIINLIA